MSKDKPEMVDTKPWCWSRTTDEGWLHGCSGCRQCLLDHKHKG